jgi:hypothetical protein
LSSTLPSALSTAEGDAIAAVFTPVLQIMPDLQDILGSSALPVSMEHMEVDSASTLCSLGSSDVIPAPHPPLPALNQDALFAKELCDVLSSLEAAIPGCGRAIACILTGTTIKRKSKKVDDCPRSGTRKEKPLKCKGKKSGAIGKVLEAA